MYNYQVEMSNSRPHNYPTVRYYQRSPYSHTQTNSRPTDTITKPQVFNSDINSRNEVAKPYHKGLAVTKDSQRYGSSISNLGKRTQIAKQSMLENRSQYRQAQGIKNKQPLKQEGQEFESKLKTIQLCLSQILTEKCQLSLHSSKLSNQAFNNLTVIKSKMRQLKNNSHQLRQMQQIIQNLGDGLEIHPLTQNYSINRLIKLINDRNMMQKINKGDHIQIDRLSKELFTVDGSKIAKKMLLVQKCQKIAQFMLLELLKFCKQKATIQRRSFNESAKKRELQSFTIQKIYDMLIQSFQKTRSEARQLSSKILQINNYNSELSKQIASLRSKTKPDFPQIGNKGTYSLQLQVSRLKQSNQKKETQIEQLKREDSELHKQISVLQQKIKQAGRNEQLSKNQDSRFKRKSLQSRQMQSNISVKTLVGLQQQLKRLAEQLTIIKQQNQNMKLQRQQMEFAAKQQQKQFKKDQAYISKILKEKEEIRQQKQKFAKTVNKLQQELNMWRQKADEREYDQRQKQSQLGKMVQSQRIKVEKNANIIKELTLKNQQLISKYQLLNQQNKRQKQNLQKTRLQNRSLIDESKQLTSLNQAIKKLYVLTDEKNKQIQQANRQVQFQKKQIYNLSQKLIEKDRQINNSKIINNRKFNSSPNQNELKSFKTQIQQQKATISSLTSSSSLNQKQLQQSILKIRNLQEKQKQSIIAIKGSESKIINLQRELDSLITKYDRKIKQKDKQIQDLMHTNDYYQQMLEQMPGLKVNSSFSVDYKRSQNANKNRQLEDQINNLTQQLRSSVIYQQQIQSELKDKQAIIKELNSQSQQKQRQRQQIDLNRVSKLQFQNYSLKAKISQTQQFQRLNQVKLDDYARVNSFYQHQLLLNYYHHKLFLTETIENQYNLRIKRTKLIYRYDTLNKINFHQYIDSVSNILLILKTADGMFIAGYSEGPFLKKTSDKDGIIFSLTNRKFFTLVERNRRAITYDEYYMIFGNSEIRLKSLQNKIFSNFAISNGYYKSNGQKVTVLLGGGPNDRETELQSYEIYQVLFDDY